MLKKLFWRKSGKSRFPTTYAETARIGHFKNNDLFYSLVLHKNGLIVFTF